MHLGTVITCFESTLVAVVITEVINISVLNGHGAGPPAGGIDGLRKGQGFGIAEAHFLKRSVHLF